MFRIRRLSDDLTPINRNEIKQIQTILREQFPFISEREVNSLPEKLRNPFKLRFHPMLFVADNEKGDVKGFALLLYEPEKRFCYLDFISTATRITGRGIGGALYQRIRQEALALGCIGLFLECLPDDPRLSPDPEVRRQNAARLKFYERYGARPIINTAYETPVKPGEDNPPYLVFDNLGQNKPLSRAKARQIVREILERKYRHLCPPEYIEMVVRSIKDDPVRLREPRYIKEESIPVRVEIPEDKKIVLLVNDKHEIHHVRERGYVESPIRIKTIRTELEKIHLFIEKPVQTHSEAHIRAIHDTRYLNYFKRVCELLEPGKSIYPYVFPIRNTARPPRELPVRAGYYCIDTFTPLNKNAYLAARRAVDCALTGAEFLLEGNRIAYALVRPPGHHAERKAFGGFCYFNSAAAAAHFFSAYGKVAILDIDYHHGNGQQDIFYSRRDVLTISIHGHPRFAYPYFSGFADENGADGAEGFNINFPLPEKVDSHQYREVLKGALKKIVRFKPNFLIVCLGLDTARGDPTGTWSLHARDFEVNGRLIGGLKLPLLVVQEGGYNNRNLGVNARNFFLGLWAGVHS